MQSACLTARLKIWKLLLIQAERKSTQLVISAFGESKRLGQNEQKLNQACSGPSLSTGWGRLGDFTERRNSVWS